MEDDFDWDAQEVSLDGLSELLVGDWFSTHNWDDCWYEFKGFTNDGNPLDRIHLGMAARKRDRLLIVDSSISLIVDPVDHQNIRVKKRLFSTKLYSPEQSGDTEDDI